MPNDHLKDAKEWPLSPPGQVTKWRQVKNKNGTYTFSTIINGNNNGATREPIEENGLNRRAFHGKSVWWYFEWHRDFPLFEVNNLEANTKGSTFDTTLAVMRVDVGNDLNQNSSQFRWNNNAVGGGGAFSEVKTPLGLPLKPRTDDAPGTKIYFMVDGVGASSGKIRLRVEFTGKPIPDP